MKSNIRKNLERNLMPALKKNTKGKILEIGSGNLSYKNFVNYKDYKTLDVSKNLNVDFCEDIHKTNISSDSFDTILMIEVLEHLYNPFKAIEQVHRILKKDGYVMATTPFIHPYHGEPNDFYRYTQYGLKKIFEKFDEVKMIEYGNVFGASLDLLTSYKFLKPLKIFNFVVNNKFFDFFSKKTPTGILIIAKK